MKSRKLLIIGAGSFASEVAQLVRETGDYQLSAFLDTRSEYGGGRSIDGFPVLSLADPDLQALSSTSVAICALGTTRRSEELESLSSLGLTFCSLIHPTAHVPESVEVGSGVIIGAGVVIGHATVVGQHTLVNRGVLIGHHTSIGTSSVVSPGANIAARVCISERVYLGMGSIVVDGRSIGARSVVGAGSVVVHDLPARVKVVGMPARVVKRDIDGL